MDTVRLEKQVRMIPLFCCLGYLALRGIIRDKSSDLIVIWGLILASIAILSFLFRIYLEKRNGTFVLKRYYLMLGFILFSVAIFIYNLVAVPA
jgi:hypothetical protein